jgi:integrase
MQSQKKRKKLPPGLHWDSRSPYIFFKWRDAMGKQRRHSTQTNDPDEALLTKLQFLQEQRQKPQEIEAHTEDLGKLPLNKAAELYFGWKSKNSGTTIQRERRIFKAVLKAFGSGRTVRSVRLFHLRQYQQQRRSHVSHMKQPVTARTVNYELDLLRGVMQYAGSWTAELDAGYQSLPERKSKRGQYASEQQLATIISTASRNEPWQVAMYCAAVAIGTGCRGGEVRTLQLRDIKLEDGCIQIRPEKAKNRTGRKSYLLAIAEWGLHHLLARARNIGAMEPEHYLLPLNIRKSRILSKATEQKWDVTKPMTTWVKSWRKLMAKCGMQGFRFTICDIHFGPWVRMPVFPLRS